MSENSLNIVLHEPEIPQNTGNISRTCAATGCALHLIEPLGFKVTDSQLKRAGLDYWKYLDITYYKSLDDFFSRNNGDYYFFSTKADNIYTKPIFAGKTYLFFGKETAGLPVTLLKENASKALRLPMMTGIRSLNLSNSVAIAIYEVLRQWNFDDFQINGHLADY
ncbi:tRNA (cytidine(34)-2'-O)-methyltransferase [bioreactor metagenome]|uniref:tRNA (Cytidine(34)-2'-O)-methyltransferase n=1 Tax=bioreactor metagenome TaxID=1076179 RepID=A0A645D472_9ZZZZ|nr:tRNA (cytidine(34)-2'-O)-methyltransferase [Oscillospiraceae bacterium]